MPSIRTLCLYVIICLFATSCEHDSFRTVTPEVSGCTDPNATNYNPKATKSTTCTYAIQSFVGRYAVTDTAVNFVMVTQDSGRMDTSITDQIIDVNFVSWDRVQFDKIIQCTNYDNSVGIRIDPVTHGFSYIDRDNQYTMISGSGYFKGDSLIYDTRKRANYISTAVPRRGRGVRVRVL